MVEIPNLPDKEELEYREKELVLTIREQLAALNKKWTYALVAVLVLAVPLGVGLSFLLSRQLISSYNPPVVNTDLYNPEDLQIVRASVIPVVRGVYSAYAQVLNPNINLAAWQVEYRFVFKSTDGQILREVQGESYLERDKSKFLVVPRVEIDQAPTEVELVIDSVRWTGVDRGVTIGFDVLQQNSGISEEGNFFVESEIRNRQDFRLKQVHVEVVVFDQTNQRVVAVNSTKFTDLEPFENRFVRVLWPDPIANIGQIQIVPSVNPLETGATLQKQEQVPVR